MLKKIFGEKRLKFFLFNTSPKSIKSGVFFSRAVSAKDNDDMRSFKKCLLECKDIEGYSPRVVREYIDLYCVLKQPLELEKFYERVQDEIGPSEIEAFVNGYLRLGLVEQTIPLLDSLDVSSIDINKLFQIAKEYFSARQFETTLYILLRFNQDNSKPDLVNLIAKSYLALGKFQEAKEQIESALSVNNVNDECYSTLIYVCINLGELERAKKILVELSGRNKTTSEIFRVVAYSFFAAEKNEQALDVLQLAIYEGHASDQIYLLITQVYEALGNFQAAESCYLKAMGLFKGSFDVVHGFACFLFRRREVVRAKSYFLELLEKHPNDFALLNDFGTGLLQSGYVEEALSYYECSVRLFPESSVGLNNYAVTLREAGRFEKASEVLGKALRLREKNEDLNLYNNIELNEIELNQVMTDFDLGYHLDAERVLSSKLEQNPGNQLVLWYRSLTRLVLGDFAGGWDDYQSRWVAQEVVRRPFNFDSWGGETLAGSGRTLLVFSEQGIGDEIMFASCFCDLHQHVDNLVIECDRKLAKIYKSSFPWARIIPKPLHNQEVRREDVKAIDLQVPVGDLPKYFRRARGDFENKTPYLAVDTVRINYWQNKLDSIDENIKIGVSWKGGTKKTRKILRSINLNDLFPILELRGITWINLQYGEVEKEIETFQQDCNVKIHNFADAIDDYYETAALVKSLDCVVSIQTAIVHLAGALGTRVECLLPSAPEWRYRMGDDGAKTKRKMLWYPSVNLHTQSKTGDWSDVIQNVKNELRSDFQK